MDDFIFLESSGLINISYLREKDKNIILADDYWYIWNHYRGW